MDWSSPVGWQENQIFRAAGQAGARIAHCDCMIAATALLARAPLLTRNVAHFSRVPGLDLDPTDQHCG